MPWTSNDNVFGSSLIGYGDSFFKRCVRMVRTHNVLLDPNTVTDEEIEFTLKNLAYPRIWFYLKTAKVKNTGLPVFYDPQSSTSIEFGDEQVFRQALIDSANESFASSIAWIASAYAASILTSKTFHIVDNYADLAKHLEKIATATLEQLKQELCCSASEAPLKAPTKSPFDDISFYFAPAYDPLTDTLYERIELNWYERAIMEVIVGSTPEPAYYEVPNYTKPLQLAMQVQNAINNRSKRILTTLNAGGRTPAKIEIVPKADLPPDTDQIYQVEVALERLTAVARDKEIIQTVESINLVFRRYLYFVGSVPSQSDLDKAFGVGNSVFTVGPGGSVAPPTSPATTGGGIYSTLPTPTPGAIFWQITAVPNSEFIGNYTLGTVDVTTSLPPTLRNRLYKGYKWRCVNSIDPNFPSNNGVWVLEEEYPKLGFHEIKYGTKADYNELTRTGPHGIFLQLGSLKETKDVAGLTPLEDLSTINTFYFRVDDEIAWGSYFHTLTEEDVKESEVVGNTIPFGVFRYRVTGPNTTTLPANTTGYSTEDSDNLPIVSSIAFRVPAGASAAKIAQAFNHSLFNYYKTNNVLGAIIKNINAVTCTVNRAEPLTIAVVIDFTELPTPISIATGNYSEPLSSFTNEPKSLYLASPLVKPTSIQADDSNPNGFITDGKGSALLVRQKFSDRHQYVRDKLNIIYTGGYKP